MLSTIISSFEISNIFSLLITFIIIYVSRYYYRYFTRPNPLPGPFPLPIIGNVHQQGGLQFDDWLLTLYEKYGDIYELNLGGIRLIVLSGTDLIENMNISSASKAKYYRSPVIEGMTEYGSMGLGVANNNDPKSWRYNRQFFSQALMTPSFNYQAIEWTNELWNEMESYWNDLGENHELNLIKWMHRFTNEIIFRISTGVKNNCVASHYKMILLENNKKFSIDEKEMKKVKESEKFIESIEIYMNGVMYFLIYNNFMRHYFPFIREKANNYLKNRDYFHDKILNIIKERKIEIENTPLDQPLRHDMLTSHIIANTPRDTNATKHGDTDMLRPMTDREISGNIVDAMTGGTDTTANLFCFAVYFLGHHPEVKKRLQQELDEVFGNDLTKPITYGDLERLHYCEAVIKEVTRLRPVVFTIGRVFTEEVEVGGYTWPEETAFSMFYYAMMRRKDYWTDPEKFDPDRFYKIDESDKYLLEKKHAKNSFTIFGGGIRICPGRKLAMIELRFLLASIYRKYDVELANMNASLKNYTHFISVCKELIVKVKPRKF
uniref:Putative cytochrome P450 4d20 n=1 Tax=Anthurium amnicola TaxID=1678845 RepID=A0A1D1XKH2_9ARAE